MSLVEQVMESLAAKGARVCRCPDLAAAVRAIRAAVPADAAVAAHRSVPAGLLELLTGLRAMLPEGMGEGARAAVLRAEYGLTGATALVAATGSIVLAEADGFGRAISNMARTHLVVAATADVVPSLDDGLDRAVQWAQANCGRPVPPFMTIISGPSRTGDIEFVLVKGAHGPEHVLVYLVDQL